MTATTEGGPVSPPGVPTPFVFVTVGTDHHPFGRLVSWVDEWAARRPGVRCLVQSGTAPAPRHANWRDSLPYAEMVDAMRGATAVVCHGGPATIMEARRLGHAPIVVPRTKDLGEHVDDHQAAFTRRLAAEGTVQLAESGDHLFALLDRSLACPPARSEEADAGVAETVRRFAEVADALAADASRLEAVVR